MDSFIEPVGPFGGFQKLYLFIVGCVTMVSAMYYNLIIINYFEPVIECHLRSDNSSMTLVNDHMSNCEMWNRYKESLASGTRSPYYCKVDNETYGLNVISEWNLSCTNQFLASVTQSLYLVGSLCAFVTELVVNKYGRRKASVIFYLSLITVALLSQSLISDMKMLSIKDHQIKFLVYTVAQLIIGVLVYCLSASTYMHLIDLTTSSYHRIFANINISFFLLGEVVCMGVYFITKNWRLTSWVCILCTILCFVMYNFFALESPRWLIESAQYEEAYEILKKIARFNKKKTLDSIKFKDYLLKQMQSNLGDKSRENSDLEDQLDMINRPTIDPKELTFTEKVCLPKTNFYKVSLMIVLFNCLSLNFFGVSISIVNVTHVNKFLILLLSSVSGFLGALMCNFNDKIGYKASACNFLFLSGATSLGVVLIPDQEQINWILITKVACSLLGKAAVVAAYSTAIVIAADSYDRRIKVNLIVLLNFAGCLLTVVTPQINFLRFYWRPLPYTIYSVTALVSFCIIYYLPEPRNLQKKKTVNYM